MEERDAAWRALGRARGTGAGGERLQQQFTAFLRAAVAERKLLVENMLAAQHEGEVSSATMAELRLQVRSPLLCCLIRATAPERPSHTLLLRVCAFLSRILFQSPRVCVAQTIFVARAVVFCSDRGLKKADPSTQKCLASSRNAKTDWRRQAEGTRRVQERQSRLTLMGLRLMAHAGAAEVDGAVVAAEVDGACRSGSRG